MSVANAAATANTIQHFKEKQESNNMTEFRVGSASKPTGDSFVSSSNKSIWWYQMFFIALTSIPVQQSF